MKKSFLYSSKYIALSIIVFILFNGCKHVYSHYFNQEIAVDVHIDSLLMLKLLQNKNPKYKKVNIKNIANCEEDPFKRLLNRDNYLKKC